ncbi:hypothetical protein FRX31_013803, partial [Thalictrum thalictroides]
MEILCHLDRGKKLLTTPTQGYLNSAYTLVEDNKTGMSGKLWRILPYAIIWVSAAKAIEGKERKKQQTGQHAGDRCIT